MSELEALIAEQAKDDTYRVHSMSLDAFPSGADIVHLRKRQLVTDPRHGTLACSKSGCHCDKCREASAKYQREYNRRRGTKRKFVCECCGSTKIRYERNVPIE